MSSLSLVWDLIAVDNASSTFRQVGSEAEGTHAAIGKLIGGFTLLAAGGAVVEAVKAASTFEASMLLIQTQAGATRQEVEKMSPAILALAGQVAQSPEALANSLYHVESTGLRGAKALEAVKVAAEGAKVGHADLEQTTNALTAAVASGMSGTEDMTRAMGALNTIVGSGDMKMQDLNEALGTGLLVTTKQYGVTLPDVGAALADFGDNNIRGADAATKLRMAVQALESPAKGGQAALAGIGITQRQLADDMQTGGLNKAITDLHQHLVDSGKGADEWGQIVTDAFGKKAGTGVLTLVGTFDRFEQKYEEVTKGAGGFGDAWAATTHTASFAFSSLKDSVEALGIKFGSVLLPPLADAARWLNDKLSPALSASGRWMSQVGEWVTTNLVPPLKELWGWISEKLVPAFQDYLHKALDGARAAIDIVTRAFQSHRAELSQVWDAIKGLADIIVQYVIPVLGTVLKVAFEIVGKAIEVVIAIVSKMVDIWNSMWQDAKNIGHWFATDFVEFFVGAWTAIKNGWSALAKDIGNVWQDLKHYVMDPVAWVIRYVIDDGIIGAWDWVSDHLLGGALHADKLAVPSVPPLAMATGGPVVGPGTGTSDSILARLSHGEFVVNAAATSVFRPLLEAINGSGKGAMTGGLPGFKDGGGVWGFLTDVFVPGAAAMKAASPKMAALMSDPAGAIKDLVQSLMGGLSSAAPLAGMLGKMMSGMAGNVGSALLQAIGLSGGNGGALGPVGSGVERWRGIVDAVLTQLGQSTSLDNGVLALISKESGGNPNAINLTDSNARAGHPSQGLMQTIPSTFAAYAGPYASRGITDPFANIYAGVNYALQRYGPSMLAAGGRHDAKGNYIGYKDGTNYVPSDQLAVLHKGEAVIPAAQNQGAPFVGGGEATFHIYDADGVLMGTMRGHAESVVAGALTSATTRARNSR